MTNHINALERYRTAERHMVRVLGDEDVGEGLPKHEMAEVSLFRGDLWDALQLFQDAAKDDPESPLAQAGLIFLALAGRPEERLDELAKLAGKWPELERPNLYLAMAKQTGGDLDGAELGYLACVKLLPEDPVVWSALAGLRASRGDKAGAVEAVQGMLALEPASFRIWRRASEIFFRLTMFRQAFALALEARRRFRGWKARALPLTLPFHAISHGRRLAILLGIEVVAIGTLITLIALGHSNGATTVVLVLLVVTAAWLQLSHSAVAGSRRSKQAASFARAVRERET